jgi:phospholipase/carboxylesterase
MHEYNILEKGKPLGEADKAIIFLHGRGSTAENIITLAKEFPVDDFYVAAPQATNNTWYPYSFMVPEYQNEPWLTSAIQTVKRLIDEISEFIPPENIYIMGFSQGACLTLETTSRYAVKYAGIAAFTGGLIGDSVKSDKYNGNFSGTKVFLGNSDIDPHIPVVRSEESKKVMENLGADVLLKIYPEMPHTINEDEIETVKELFFYP